MPGTRKEGTKVMDEYRRRKLPRYGWKEKKKLEEETINTPRGVVVQNR